MSALREARCEFSRGVGQLLVWAYANGYPVALGEVERDSRVAALNAQKGVGNKNSLHILGLAVDLRLYKAGVYQELTPAYEPLGRYWEGLNPNFCWGGHFGDGNHFSRTWEGRK